MFDASQTAPSPPPGLVDHIEIADFLTALLCRAANTRGWLRFASFNKIGEAQVQWVEWDRDLSPVIAMATQVAIAAAEAPDGGFTTVTIAPCLFRDRSSAGKGNIAAVLGVFTDFDEMPEAAFHHAVNALGAMRFSPSIIVRSGGEWQSPTGAIEIKRHAYWLFDEPLTEKADIDRAWALDRRLVTACGSDRSMTIVHPMRFPGSVWRKAGRPPRMTSMESADVLFPDIANSADPAVRTMFTLDDLEHRLRDAKPFAGPQASRGAGADGDRHDDRHDAGDAPGGQQAGSNGTGESDADLIARIIHGDELHDSLTKLAWRRISDGKDPVLVAQELRGLMDQSAARTARPDEWQARRDDIGRTVQSAIDKQRSESGGRQPDPLSVRVPPAAPFPVGDMPPAIRATIEAAERIAEVCDAMAATAVLAVAAIAVGRLAGAVCITGHSPRPVALYTMVIAESGERKSSLDQMLTTGIRQFERELGHRYADVKRRHDATAKTREAAEKRILATKLPPDAKRDQIIALGAKPAEPPIPVVLINDTTVEALTKIMASNGGHAGIVSAEGASLVGGHSLRDRDRQLAACGRLSELWDGQSFSIDRVGAGRITITDPRLSWCVSLQPSVAGGFFANAAILGQGLPNRLLVAMPAPRAGSRTLALPQVGDTTAVKVFTDRCIELLRIAHGINAAAVFTSGTTTPIDRERVLSLTVEADKAWWEFAHRMERAQAPGAEYAGVKGWASKCAEQALRIAGVLTLFDDPDATEIDLERMQAAIAAAGWYAGEWRRCVHIGHVPERIEKARRLLQWLIDRFPGGSAFTARDIYSPGACGISTRAAADAVIAVLVTHGYVLDADDLAGRMSGTAGRPPLRTWKLHPAAASAARQDETDQHEDQGTGN